MRAVKTLGVLVSAALLLSSCGWSYDEAAHQAAVAEEQSWPPGWEDDLTGRMWEPIRASAERTCGQDEQTFAYTVALNADGDTLDELRTTVTYVCPDRLDELDAAVRDLAG